MAGAPLPEALGMATGDAPVRAVGPAGWTVPAGVGNLGSNQHQAGQELMGRRPTSGAVNDEDVKALLERYACPMPFHEVRTRFLGSIATPVLGTSPIKTVESLWGGKLPEFESLDAANVVIGALVMGLWNRLTRHQERGAPFRLVRHKVAATRDGLAALALIRRHEIDGFIEGLFDGKEAVDLPERAHRGVSVLGELRALMAGIVDMVPDTTKTTTEKEIEGTLRQIGELTKIAEHEIHEVVLSCTRARRQMLAAMPAKKPTLH